MQAPRQHRKRKVVMIVEAGEIGLSTRKLLVESVGFNCLSAVSVDQAYILLERHPVDLLLFDTDLTRDDEGVGLNFLEEFKRERKLPAYVLTGAPFVPEQFRSVVDGSFQKAADPETMIEEVVRILG